MDQSVAELFGIAVDSSSDSSQNCAVLKTIEFSKFSKVSCDSKALFACKSSKFDCLKGLKGAKNLNQLDSNQGPRIDFLDLVV